MKIHNVCVIAAPLESTWRAVTDLGRLAAALPGATLAPGDDPGSYRGHMKIKIGPVTAEYAGLAAIEEIDADRRVAVFRVSGREVRGQGGATATIRNSVAPASAGGTQLTIDTELQVSGIAAQLGHAMIEDVSATLLGEFAQRLERELAGAPVAAASSGALDVGGAAAVALRRRLVPVALYAALLVVATAGAYALGRRR